MRKGKAQRYKLGYQKSNSSWFNFLLTLKRNDGAPTQQSTVQFVWPFNICHWSQGGGRGVEGGNVYLLHPESNIVYGMGTNLKTQNKAVFNIEHSK